VRRVFGKRGRSFWKKKALFLENERIRFEKRLRSFFRTTAFVFPRVGGAGEMNGR